LIPSLVRKRGGIIDVHNARHWRGILVNSQNHASVQSGLSSLPFATTSQAWRLKIAGERLMGTLAYLPLYLRAMRKSSARLPTHHANAQQMDVQLGFLQV
jgi:hypothetical protein